VGDDIRYVGRNDPSRLLIDTKRRLTGHPEAKEKTKALRRAAQFCFTTRCKHAVGAWRWSMDLAWQRFTSRGPWGAANPKLAGKPHE